MLAHRRFSAEEYQRLYDLGILSDDERTELLEGEIVPVAAQNTPHIGAIFACTASFIRLLGDTHHVGAQVTVRLTDWSKPDPDFVIISRRSWSPGQPLTRGDLFVEVADDSLQKDRVYKSSLYAMAGIPEYWILNLVDRQLEVYRHPAPEPTAIYGHRYASRSIHVESESVVTLCRPDVSVPVRDLLPPPAVSEQP
ncbi:MAG: Uma2 family endonuclease [Candidatus Xenobia bacterium]